MMDVKNGRLIELQGSPEAVEKMKESFEQNNRRPLLEIDEAQREELKPLEPYKRKNRMRNWPCPCGSTKKFKNCCWSKYL